MGRTKIFINKINANKFFTPKKLAMMIFGAILFITAFILTFVLLDINISYIFTTVGKEIRNNPILVCLLILLILQPASRYINILAYLKPRMRRLGLEISKVEYFFLFLKVYVINSITPFASGAEPYCIYWMKTRGANIEDANAISLVSTVLAGFTEIIITIPSFIYISTFYGSITQTPIGLTIYWFIFAGLCINFIIMGSFFAIGQSKHIHIWISTAFNFILRKLGRKYLSKEEIRQKYAVDNVFKKKFMKELKEYKLNALIVLSNALVTCSTYLAVFLSMACMGVIQPSINNSDYLFNITNVAVTANNFIPIPGAEGTLQITIITLSSIFKDLGLAGQENNITQSIALWRIFTNYSPLLFGGILISLYYGYKIAILHFRKIHNISPKAKVNPISFIVTVDQFNKQNILRCLESIVAIKQKKEIIVYTKQKANKSKLEKLINEKPELGDIKVAIMDSANSQKTFRTIINSIQYKYFMFINSNDYIHPEASDRINDPMNSNKFDIVAYPQFIINENENKNQWILTNRCKKDNKEYYLSNNYVSIFGMLFNAKYVKDHLKYFVNLDIYKNGISTLPYAIIKADNFMFSNTFFYYHAYENKEKDTKASLINYVNVMKYSVNEISNRRVAKHISNYIALMDILLSEKINNADIDKETKKELFNELTNIKQTANFKYKQNELLRWRFMYCKYRGILP